jgi:hypothetical protein
MKEIAANQFVVDETPERLRIQWRTGSNPIGCFFLFWMSGWTVACVFITSVALKDPELRNIAGAAVFWSGWCFGFVLLVSQFLGRERIVFDETGLVITQGRLIRVRTAVPIAEIFGFTTESETIENDGRKGSSSRLEIRTAGRPIRTGQGLGHVEVRRLAALLREYHKRLPTKRSRDAAWPPERERILFRPKRTSETPPDKSAFRSPQDSPIERPSDTRMRLREGFDFVRFSTRGRFTFGGVLVCALLNAFWNGITGIFVYNLFWGGPADKPQGFEWYEQFLFLIPFEIVGLVMLSGMLLVALEPVRVWSHCFSTTNVRECLTWLGVGRCKTYDLSLLDRIEVRRIPYAIAKLPKRLNLATLWTPAGSPAFSVVIVEMGNREVCSLDGFTFGEACWLADVVIRRNDFSWVD